MTGDLVQWVQAGLSDAPAWGSTALAVITYRRTRNRKGWLQLLEGAGVTAAQLEAVLRERPKTAELFCTIMRIAEETAQEERQRALAALVVAGVHSDSDQVVDELLVLRRAVERLDDPHFRLLLIVDAHATTPVSPEGGFVGVSDAYLLELWPVADKMIVPLRLALEREGLIRNVLQPGRWAPSDVADDAWLLTDFGTSLLGYYRALGGRLP
jgi:hypothetical protein